MKTDEMTPHQKGTIVDVRTPGEFTGGHLTNAVNIPLNEIPEKLDELRKMIQPLILCCASGGRSGQAAAFLKQHGFDCINGGSWMDVNYRITQK